MFFFLRGGQQVYTFCAAAICWAIWKRRNAACFENRGLKNPAEILSYTCALMTYWAGLYGVEMQGKIMDGVKLLLSCASWVMAQQQRTPHFWIYLLCPLMFLCVIAL